MNGECRFSIDERIPVVAECDVLVVGGGPGGIGASVMAARCGAKTVLAERFGTLGGMASVGEVQPFMPNHFKAEEGQANASDMSMDRPVFLEWTKAIASYLPPALKEKALADKEAAGEAAYFGKEEAALGAEDVCLKAGVKILLHHTLVRTIVKDGRVEFAVFNTKSGFVAVKAKAYVDSSGDGDLAALSGCPFEVGNAQGNCQPMTLCFKLSHVDDARVPSHDELQKLFQKAKASGALDCPRENLLMFKTKDPSTFHFNTTRVVRKSALNGETLSDAELEGRRQLRQYLAWLRGVPGFENAMLHSMAQHIGVRESRRVSGHAKLTREDFVKRSKFKDAIARCNYSVDIHSPDGAGTEYLFMPRTEYYEIPFGCIVPANISNLALGSRCISADHAIHSSLRVMPVVCSIGQAAGAAAAMAATGSVALDKLDGTKVREKLKEQGAWL